MKSTFDPISQKIDSYKADRVEVVFNAGDWISVGNYWEYEVQHNVGDSGKLFVQVFEGVSPVGIESYRVIDENRLALRISKLPTEDVRFSGTVIVNN
jgi:hypothetical protein